MRAHIESVPLVCALAVLVVTDIRWRRLPNAVVLPLWAAGLVAWTWTGGISGALHSLGASAALGVPAALAWRLGLCGGGDVKLLAALGGWLGLVGGVAALALGLLLGGVWAGVALLADGELRRDVVTNLLAAAGQGRLVAPRRELRRTVPFGAALAAAGGVVALWMGGPHV